MDQRNLILAIVFSVSILLGWQVFIEGPRIEEERARVAAEDARKKAQQPAPQPGQTAQPGVPGAPPAASVPGAPPPAPGAVPAPPAGAAAVDRSARVTIDTRRVKGSIRLTGGQIDDLTLLDYRQKVKKDSANIVLLAPDHTQKPYHARFGWVSPTPGVVLPDANAVWTADSSTLSVGKPVTLTWTNPQGIVFSQKISIDQNYMFTVEQSVRNTGDGQIAVHPFGLISRTGTPETSGFFVLHEGPIGVFGERLAEFDYDDVQDEGTIEKTGKGNWIGITDKYFATALIPEASADTTSRFLGTTVNSVKRYQVDYRGPPSTVAPGQAGTFTTRLFAGAKEVRLLDAYSESFGIQRFDRLVDFGWFYFLTKPIFYVIEYFYRILGNFGLAILLLTVIIKLLFFPLANKSYKSMSRLKKLQPKMMEIRDRFKDDRQRQNQAMMELYKKEGANPMSGCFPILIQIPVFFALYKVLLVTIEMRHAPFFGWIQDLSAPDPLGILLGFGLFEWNVPEMLQIANIGIWPIIMGLTMYLQQKLNPQPADPMQQKIFMLLPIVFTFLLGSFPAGLVIYWAWNNTLSIAQQWVIMRRMGVTASGQSVSTAPPSAPPRGKSKKKAAAGNGEAPPPEAAAAAANGGGAKPDAAPAATRPVTKPPTAKNRRRRKRR